MKKQQIYSIVLVLLMFLMLPMLDKLSHGSNMPFKSLKTEETEAIELYLNPPDKMKIITERGQIENIVNIFNTVVINKQESPDVDYSSQLVSYTIKKVDAKNVAIKIYSPYIIIDDAVYKADYKTCDILNLLGNDLIESNK